MRPLLAFLALLLAAAAQAQQRQPANVSTLPQSTPQEFDLLDNQGRWMPFGTASGGVFQGTGYRIFGVDPTGAQDATAAINAALTSSSTCWFLPKGTYKITDALIGGLSGCLRGDSSRNTILAIDSASFNLSALGVIVFPSTQGQSFTLRDIGFEFTQPQVGVRASIVPFPPAIYAQNAGRMAIRNIYIGAANTCLDARGNSGGSFIENVECGALTTGMLWDGSLDTVRIYGFHFWPFGNVFIGATALKTVYADGTNNCATIGRVDDLNVVNMSCLQASLIITSNANSGGLYQQFVNLELDSAGSQLSVAGGRVNIVNGYANGNRTGFSNVVVSGGTVDAINFNVSTGPNTVPAMSFIGGTSRLNGGTFICGGLATSCISIAGGNASFNNPTFAPTNGATYTAPYVSQSGTGGLSLTGGFFNVPAAGGSVGVSFAGDVFNNQISNFAANGWVVQVPTPHSAGQYGFYVDGATGYMTVKRGISGEGLWSVGSNGQVGFRASGSQPTDKHYWDFIIDNAGNLDLRAIKDDYSAASNFMTLTRGTTYTLTGAQTVFNTPITAPALPVSAGGGGLYVCVDSTGNLYKKATCP